MFWTRLGICSSVTSFLFSSVLFCFCFSSYGLPVLALYITYIKLFSFFFSLWFFFYINHAIVTPLHPFGLLVSKKDYIYRCSRYANNPYTLVARSFLFSFSSFFPLLYSLSSYLDYRFPSPSYSSRLSLLTFLLSFLLFLLCSFFFTDTNRL